MLFHCIQFVSSDLDGYNRHAIQIRYFKFYSKFFAIILNTFWRSWHFIKQINSKFQNHWKKFFRKNYLLRYLFFKYYYFLLNRSNIKDETCFFSICNDFNINVVIEVVIWCKTMSISLAIIFINFVIISQMKYQY